METLLLQTILGYANLALEGISGIFITFVFFDLAFIDKNVELSGISEKFEKFKRYDVFKSSLIFLVLSIYCGLFGKLAVFLKFPEIVFSGFVFIANIFLVSFVYKLYQLLHKYVPKEEKK